MFKGNNTTQAVVSADGFGIPSLRQIEDKRVELQLNTSLMLQRLT